MPSSNSTSHCEMHERNMEVIKLHSAQIEDLYDKYMDITKLLTELKVCTTSISIKSDNILSSIKEMQALITIHEERLDLLDDFKWFRDTMNKIRNRLPWIITYLIILLIAILFLLNTKTLSQIALKKLAGGD